MATDKLAVVMNSAAFIAATNTGDITTATSLTAPARNIGKVKLKREAKKLKKIDLSKNQLTLCSQLLERCPNITQLNLSHNLISKTKAFLHLSQLTVLNLSYNKISSLTSIAQLKSLKALIMKSNTITTVPALDMPHLNTLILTENRIEKVDLSLLPELDRLSLSHNSLTEFPDISSNIWLKTVSVSHNSISKVPAAFISSKHVKFDVLELSFNKVTKLKSVASLGCLTLKQLTLFGNPVCEKDDFTVKVRIICPTLQMLDNKPITAQQQSALPTFMKSSTALTKSHRDETSKDRSDGSDTHTVNSKSVPNASKSHDLRDTTRAVADNEGEPENTVKAQRGKKRKKLTPQEERKLSGVVGIKILKRSQTSSAKYSKISKHSGKQRGIGRVVGRTGRAAGGSVVNPADVMSAYTVGDGTSAW